MYINTYIHMSIYSCINIYKYIYTYTCVYIFELILTNIHIYMHIYDRYLESCNAN
jgi:hypothetical protein